MIIALGHRQGVGKDTCAEILRQKNGKRTQILSFAHELKYHCWTLFGGLGLQTPEYYNENYDAKNQTLPLGKTPREIWIEYGYYMRKISPDIWIHKVMGKMTQENYLYVITDLRYPNEFNTIHDLGGICVRIDRDNALVSEDVADIALQSYPNSEWDMVIDNNGNLDDLATKVSPIAHWSGY